MNQEQKRSVAQDH